MSNVPGAAAPTRVRAAPPYWVPPSIYCENCGRSASSFWPGVYVEHVTVGRCFFSEPVRLVSSRRVVVAA